MINKKKAKRYCCEDISLIENYQEAIADQTRMWDVHHLRECDDEGKTIFTCKQLIEMNLYLKRPASELIFVTRSMHWKLHKEIREKGGKKNGAINGKKCSIPILQFSKDGTFVKEWPSLSEASRQSRIPLSSIAACLRYGRKHAGGFVWRYKDSLQ